MFEYKHFLEILFRSADYLLSEPEEKILNLKSKTSHLNWTKMLSGFLAKEERPVFLKNGKKGNKTFAEISSLLSHKNKKIRNSAIKAFNEILEKHSDVAEAEINSVLENKKINDGLRQISRPDFSRHLSDDIDSSVVDVMVDAVSKNFNIPKRYYKLKARLMKVERLGYYEKNVEYGCLDKKYSYKKAVNLVRFILRNLDQGFVDIFEMFAKNNRIDVYPRKGKGDGAFCVHNLLSQPTYIFLNHTDDLKSVLTLAHEIGHGINNELMRKRQNSLNFGTTLATAEAASTFMEDFILEYILKEAGDELRLAIMVNKLNSDISTIFRQVACYKFEQELHKIFREKGYLSKEEIGKMFQKYMSSYMGNFAIGAENGWIYWSHIRRFFYNYSYASGLLISKSLQSSVRENPKFIKNVKGFLSAGLSDSPKNIFRKLGIDITDKKFWDKGINEVSILLKEAEKLAKKLGKI